MGEQRNLILALVLAGIILIGYQFLVLEPMQRDAREEAERQAQQAEQVDPDLPAAGGLLTAERPREEVIAESARIPIETPALSGSLSLTGARLDDLRLLRHDQTLNGDNPVSLLNPLGTDRPFYARDGWAAATEGLTDLPGSSTVWTLVSGERLTPETPVTLEYRSADDLVFTRQISVDSDYLFTIEDTVVSARNDEIALARFGLVRQEGLPPEEERTNNLAVFEGAISVVDGRLHEIKYKPLTEGREGSWAGTGGWSGITSRYWLTAVVPDQTRPFTARFRTIDPGGRNAFEASYTEAARALPPGGSLSSTGYVFAGAKDLDVLNRYQNETGIVQMTMAINWGWLWFLTKPFIWLLNHLAGWLSNFGLAILALTLIVKIILFPLANRSYASMAKMKLVMPKQKEIQERYADDRQKQQQEIMALYQREKINPLAGCIPLLPQIPIFFALYQTLFISLEMRHAPFFGWIQDLAAPDPTNMWNLFGLLPYDPSGIWLIGGILGLGAWPIFMGLTMWAQQALNPPPTDPMQARIFAFLPIVFTFVLAGFPAGLVVYWAWNNALSVGQQYIIMRRNGNETQVDKLFSHLAKRLRGDGGSSEGESKTDEGDKS